MIDYQVLATFTYPSDMVVVKTLLESNEINCYVRDELTVQVHNFYSNAIGGIRLEVPIDKYGLAQKLLIENGFANHLISGGKTPEAENDSSSILKQLAKYGLGFVVVSVFILIALIIGFIIFQ